MDGILVYVKANWTLLVALFWMLEKIVKITPTKYDDILVDIIWGGLKKIAGKK